MNRLSVYVCENYLPEFRYLVENEGPENLDIVPFHSFCDGGIPVFNSQNGIAEKPNPDEAAVLVCSHLCRAPRKDEYDKKFLSVYESAFCYSHMISDQFARFFSAEGYYVVTTGWLVNWEEHIKRQGFTIGTAREFYKSCCSKIVFLDTGIYDEADKKLKALSAYLDLPVRSIPVSLEPIRTLLKSIVTDWRVRNLKTEKQDDMRALMDMNARNSAVLHIMSRIAGAEYKRDVISMLDHIWTILFGASKSCFWNYSEDWADAPRKIKTLEFKEEQVYIMDSENKTFYALLKSGDEKFGIIEVGDFLFPKHVDKYTDLFNSIIKIASLAISNAQRYEELVISRNQYEYTSYHDALTGVYNRAYFNKIIMGETDFRPGGVFSVDIDGLKTVNDTLGHAEGDVLIQQAAETLKNTFRETDYIFRIGGDEFVVLITECEHELAAKLVKRLRENIAKINIKTTHNLSLSAGFCVSCSADKDIEKMIQTADFEMYREKRKNKEETSI